MPEEINRKIIDHISDINMPLTEHARRYLLAEGLRPETVIKTGSPMREVLTHYAAGHRAVRRARRSSGSSAGEYFVVSAHREENVDDRHRASRRCSRRSHGLLAPVRQADRDVDAPAHAEAADRARWRSFARQKRIEFLKPFGFFEWVKLQSHAFCVLSDSGTLDRGSGARRISRP